MIQAGDILLEHYNGSSNHKKIRFGQLFVRGECAIVHAGIAISHKHIIEVNGRGLTETNLTQTKETYDVIRCINADASCNAVEIAKLFLRTALSARSDTNSYTGHNVSAAKKSIFTSKRQNDFNLLNQTLGNFATTRTLSFFCSDFVVRCYQIAFSEFQNTSNISNPPFKLQSTSYPPATLDRELRMRPDFFRFVGRSTLKFRNMPLRRTP